jgi:hypothetical protein
MKFRLILGGYGSSIRTTDMVVLRWDFTLLGVSPVAVASIQFTGWNYRYIGDQ